MFGSWTNMVWGKLKRQLLVGASAFCWAILLTKIYIVFDNGPIKSFCSYSTKERTGFAGRN
jgi:hypothetical protein